MKINFNNNFFTIIRWLIFIPASFLGALLFSGLLNIFINYSRKWACYMSIMGSNCDIAYQNRLWIADAFMAYCLIYFIYKTVPKFKMQVSRLFAFLIGCVGFGYEMFLFTIPQSNSWLIFEQVIIALGLIIWSIEPEKINRCFTKQ